MQKLKKSFNIIELQTISHYATILRTCAGIQPFALANNINNCKIAADNAIKKYQEESELIEERKTGALEQSEKDMADLFKKQFEIEIPELKENKFSSLNIDGEKELPQQNGQVLKFSYRDAYFNLLGIIIS